jgi:hypothetical protein
MYNLLLTTVLVLIPQTGTCDNKKESVNRKELGLKGPVAVVIEKDCQFEKAFGEIKRTGSKDVRKCFYGNGNLAMQINSPTSFKKYNYNKYGHLINIMDIKCNNDSNNDTISIYKYEYEYNSKGSMISKKDLGTYGSYVTEYVYEYNSNGKISEIKVFNILDDLKSQTERLVYTYTNGGKKISTYSDKGLEKEEIFSGLNQTTRENKGFYWNVTNSKLDNNKHPIKMDNILESKINGKKEKLLSVVLNYDSKGNIIKMSHYKNGANTPFLVYTTQYTYDSYGNWTKSLLYINNNLTSWTEREFIYAKNENDYKKYNQDDISIFF